MLYSIDWNRVDQLLELEERAASPAFMADPSSLDLSDVGYIPAGVITAQDLDGVVTPFGFAALSKNFDEWIIPIRGTMRDPEWWADFQFRFVTCPWRPSCRIEQGFHGVYSTMIANGRSPPQFIASLRARCAAPVKLLGHSLGGPVATYFFDEGNADELLLIASPKPGDASYRNAINALCKPILSLRNPWDAIPKLPLEIMDYRHVGTWAVELDSVDQANTGPVCSHHLTTYRHLINPDRPVDSDCLPS